MDYMFNGCISLTSINLSSFKTPELYNMLSMFRDCQSLEYIDISKF